MSFYDRLSADEKIRYHKLWKDWNERCFVIQSRYPNLDRDTYQSMYHETKFGLINLFIKVGLGLFLIPFGTMYLGSDPVQGAGIYMVYGFVLWVTRYWWVFKYHDSLSSSQKKLYRRIMANGGFEPARVKNQQNNGAA